MRRVFVALLLLVTPAVAFGFDFDDDKPKTFDQSINDGNGQLGYGSVEFYKFQLVDNVPGRPTEFKPLDKVPAVGGVVIGDAMLMGKISEVAFYMIDENGKRIGDITLTPNFDGDHYRGRFALPNVPFRVVAYGKDENNKRFARVTITFVTPAL